MRILTSTALSALAGLLIGGFLTAIGFGEARINMAVSLCASIGICLAAEAADRLVAPPRRLAGFAVAVVGGSLPAVALAAWLAEGDGLALAARALATCLVFGTLMSAVFVLAYRRASLENQLLEVERGRLESHLRMLQAQIEPHFLFNTLATLSGLIEADPALARRLVDRLVSYLRATLSHARTEGGTTLGQEMELVRAYLDICRIRLGDRLSVAIDLPPDLSGLAFPGMLLQPLVENAVKHGVEPKPGPVTVTVAAARVGDVLRISVADDGAGLGAGQGGRGLGLDSGFGLDNVRARLAAAFAGRGRLELAGRRGGGVEAVLEVPATAKVPA